MDPFTVRQRQVGGQASHAEPINDNLRFRRQCRSRRWAGATNWSTLRTKGTVPAPFQGRSTGTGARSPSSVFQAKLDEIERRLEEAKNEGRRAFQASPVASPPRASITVTPGDAARNREVPEAEADRLSRGAAASSAAASPTTSSRSAEALQLGNLFAGPAIALLFGLLLHPGPPPQDFVIRHA